MACTPELCCYQHGQDGGNVPHVCCDCQEFLYNQWMIFSQPFKTAAHLVELVHLIQKRFKSHDCALSGAKEKTASDGLLSSEDLKEEKVITTPANSIYHARGRALGG